MPSNMNENLGDDWGFYVDIENLNPILPNNEIMFKKICNIKKTSPICSPSPSPTSFYYKYSSSEKNSDADSGSKNYINNDSDEKIVKKIIVNVSSTIITGALTYLILCVI